VQDILVELRVDTASARTPDREPATESGEGPSGAGLPDLQRRVLDALGHDPTGLDQLCERAGCAAGDLSAALLELELAQHVERLPGNRYQRLR
jgi:DNA processing protein